MSTINIDETDDNITRELIDSVDAILFDIDGPKCNIDALERWSNRKASVIGKPEKALGNIIQSKLNISDGQRILMIGDRQVLDKIVCNF
ncbi:hypothetical protein HUJ05_000987 [Dendroctonus ponderosae]|nr:hypothetical protein HUJ05_000987 [Dendroctonus ponderosae]